jgi:hypothetical protein
MLLKYTTNRLLVGIFESNLAGAADAGRPTPVSVKTSAAQHV